MPITKSAVKAMRQNIKRRRRNIHIKTAMKDEIKALQAAIAEGNKKLVAERLVSAQSKVDKALKNNLIHKNKAARTKSQLSKLAKDGKPEKAAEPKAAKPKAEKTVDKKPAAEKPSKNPKAVNNSESLSKNHDVS